MIRFNPFYFSVAVLLFGAEVAIAIWVNDAFIRPFFGDFLMVILLYSFIKSFINTLPVNTALATLFIAYLIELGQYFEFVYKMGLGNSALARTVLGTTFARGDLLAYTLGTVFIIVLEQARIKRSINKAYLNQ